MYGMANQGLLPRFFARVRSCRHRCLPSSCGLDRVNTRERGGRGGTGSIIAALLLAVTSVVNVAVVVLRRHPVQHHHFTAPTALPVLGSAAPDCLPNGNRAVRIQATLLLLVGVAV